ncbi:MAG TPA: trypsin-like peptidase domain-containing protein [Bellilinea sp.]|nr:trypsin-like peptidase domain-containing protein [Bellilinea sp.]
MQVDARRRMPASGIAFANDLILTAHHVVERDEGIVVRLTGGTEVPASLAGRDPGSDLAVLKLERAVAAPAEAAEGVKIGQLVLALGRPSREGFEASLGVISALGGPARTPHGSLEKYIRTDAILFPGFSGGPLVNAEGKVVGLNTSGFGPGAVLTIPAEIAWKIGAHLAEHGSVTRGYLGIRSQPVEISSTAQRTLAREQKVGLLIISVENGSPADQGGLIVGDILVGFNGQAVADHEDLFNRLTGDGVGKASAVEVLRGGQPMILQVTTGVRR